MENFGLFYGGGLSFMLIAISCERSQMVEHWLNDRCSLPVMHTMWSTSFSPRSISYLCALQHTTNFLIFVCIFIKSIRHFYIVALKGAVGAHSKPQT